MKRLIVNIPAWRVFVRPESSNRSAELDVRSGHSNWYESANPMEMQERKNPRVMTCQIVSLADPPISRIFLALAKTPSNSRG